MEKFALLKLIRELSGQCEQTNAGSATDSCKNTDGGNGEKQADTAKERQTDGETRRNMLADIMERHDRISNRIKGKR